MDKYGLVLQGGGTRGIYTSGVIDFFIDNEVFFPYVIGVSAGACNGAAYIAGQKGLGKNMYLNHIKDSRYISLNNLIKTGSLLGMDYIFDELPKNVEHFDLDSFNKSKSKFWIVATCCYSGKAAYFEKDECNDIFKVIRGSCSIPIITSISYYNEVPLLDGGISDPIPIKKSISDGNDRNVIVMTSDISHQYKSILNSLLMKRIYSEYGNLCEALYNIHRIYNNSIDHIIELEKQKKVFVIRPSKKINMRIIEKKKNKLNDIYRLGYNDATNIYEDMIKFLKG